jgi:hypothetical protein
VAIVRLKLARDLSEIHHSTAALKRFSFISSSAKSSTVRQSHSHWRTQCYGMAPKLALVVRFRIPTLALGATPELLFEWMLKPRAQSAPVGCRPRSPPCVPFPSLTSFTPFCDAIHVLFNATVHGVAGPALPPFTGSPPTCVPSLHTPL